MNLQGFSPALYAILGGAVLASLVALHFLRVRYVRVALPTLIFLQRVSSETLPRALIRRFRRWASLLLLLLLALLLLTAAADPEVHALVPYAGRVAVLVDRSASTATLVGAGEGSLWEELCAEVLERRAVGEFGDGPALYAVGAVPVLLADFGSGERRWQEGLAGGGPEPASADWEPAVRVAVDRLRDHGGGRLIVYSDGDPRLRAALGLASGVEVELHERERPAFNRAITALEFERLERAPERVELRIQLERHGVIEGPWALVLNSLDPASEDAPLRVDLDPSAGETLARLELAADGRRMRAALEGSDPLELDDSCEFRLPTARRQRISIAGDAPALLRRALDLDPGVEVVAAGAEADVVLVLDPAEAPPQGGSARIIWRSRPASDGIGSGAREPLELAPPLADLPVRDLALEHARGLSVAAGDEVLMTCGQRALVVRRPGDLVEVSMPLEPPSGMDNRAFAPLVLLSLLRELAGRTADPDGGERVALADPIESQPAPLQEEAAPLASIRESPREWRWIALAFLCLLCIEWALVRRRIVP